MAIGVEEEGKGWLERTAMLKDGSGVEARDGRWGWGDVSLFEAGEGGGRAVLNGGHSKLIPSGSGPSAGRQGCRRVPGSQELVKKKLELGHPLNAGATFFRRFYFTEFRFVGQYRRNRRTQLTIHRFDPSMAQSDIHGRLRYGGFPSETLQTGSAPIPHF